MRAQTRVLAILLILLIACVQIPRASAVSAEIELPSVKTSNASGDEVDGNHYDSIHDVYVHGDPHSDGEGKFTPGATYWVQVTSTSGKVIYGNIFSVEANDDGIILTCLDQIGVELASSGNPYKVSVSPSSSFDPQKSDNFNIDSDEDTDYCPLTIEKEIDSESDLPTDLLNREFTMNVFRVDDGRDIAVGQVSVSAALQEGETIYLLPGEYRVEELRSNMPAGVTFGYIDYGGGDDIYCHQEPVETHELILGREGATVTVYNHYDPEEPTSGTLTIRKELAEGSDPGWHETDEFDIRISQAPLPPDYDGDAHSQDQPWDDVIVHVTINGEVTIPNVTIPNLPTGCYLVEEIATESSRYSPDYIWASGPDADPCMAHEGVDGSPDALLWTIVAVAPEGNSEVTITNRYSAPPIPPEPENHRPNANDDSATTPAGTPVTITVLVNDTDPDGDPLNVIATTTAANGSIALVGNLITYTPMAGFSGTDTFTYTITDGNGGTDTATVTITVTPPAPPPPPPPPPPPIIPDPIPGGPAVLPNAGGTDPLLFAGIGLVLSVIGFLLKKR